MISVNGTFFKNKYIHNQLIACTLDDNSHIVPLTFSIMNTQNDASSNWFFHNLKCALCESDGLVIISNRHASIPKGVSNVYDYAISWNMCISFVKNSKIDTQV